MRSPTRGLPDEHSQRPQGGTQYFSREPKCAGRLLAKPGLATRRRKASSRTRTEARCRCASSGIDCRGRAQSIVFEPPNCSSGRQPLRFSFSVEAAVSAAKPTKSGRRAGHYSLRQRFSISPPVRTRTFLWQNRQHGLRLLTEVFQFCPKILQLLFCQKPMLRTALQPARRPAPICVLKTSRMP